MVEVNWTDQAIDDISNIAKFIAKDSEKYAAIQTESFFERAQILEKIPFVGRIVPESNNKLIRELILGNYRLIYFIVDKNRIDIITIHHGSMLLENSPAFKKK
jgi:addiction module RelE/StbE family toxin